MYMCVSLNPKLSSRFSGVGSRRDGNACQDRLKRVRGLRFGREQLRNLQKFRIFKQVTALFLFRCGI